MCFLSFDENFKMCITFLKNCSRFDVFIIILLNVEIQKTIKPLQFSLGDSVMLANLNKFFQKQVNDRSILLVSSILGAHGDSRDCPLEKTAAVCLFLKK